MESKTNVTFYKEKNPSFYNLNESTYVLVPVLLQLCI